MFSATRARLAGGFVRSASFNPAMIQNKAGVRVAMKRNFRYASAKIMAQDSDINQQTQTYGYGVSNSMLMQETGAKSFEDILKCDEKMPLKRSKSTTFNPHIVTSL